MERSIIVSYSSRSRSGLFMINPLFKPPPPPPSDHQALSFNHQIYHLGTSYLKHKDDRRHCFQNPRLFLHLSSTINSRKPDKRQFVAFSSVPSPFGPPSDSWKTWILCTLIAIVLPFLGLKLGPLLKLKQEVETAEECLETIEHVVDAVEKVAEEVEKVAEDIADGLPEGGKLRKVATSVENVAKEAVKDAQLVEDLINKIEGVEEKVDSFVESVVHVRSSREIDNAQNDQKKSQ